MTVYAEAGNTHGFQGHPLFRKNTLALFQREISVEIKASLGHDIRFECPDRARGSIPGVRCGSEPLLHTFPVHFQKSFIRQDHFSPHFKALRQLGSLQSLF
jgi:hypothetical protein